MTCPLCDHDGATAVTEELAIVVTCEPCGGGYSITWSAADEWITARGAARTLGLEAARKHLANLRRYAEVPQVQTADVRAWVKRPS